MKKQTIIGLSCFICGMTGMAQAITLDFELGYTGAGTTINALGAEAEFNHSSDQNNAGLRELQNTREYGSLVWQGSANNYGYSSVNWLGETPNPADVSWLITQSEARAQFLYGAYAEKDGNEFAVGGPYDFLNASHTEGSAFILEGAWFSGIEANLYEISDPWLSASSITIEGFKDGLSTGTASLSLSIDEWGWLDATGLGVIDSFTIINGTPMSTSWGQSGGADAAFYRFDDLTYTVAPVPEPATMLLFGTGLVGLVVSRLRKKKE